MGGAPRTLRSDNLSAATHELRAGGRTLTERFAAVLDHYGMRSTRIMPGEAHQNGVAEKANDLLKRALAQALVIRGSSELGLDQCLDVRIYSAYGSASEDLSERRKSGGSPAEVLPVFG